MVEDQNINTSDLDNVKNKRVAGRKKEQRVGV